MILLHANETSVSTLVGVFSDAQIGPLSTE